MDPQGLPATLTTALHGELEAESRAGRLRAAGIGRGRNWQIDPAERGDCIRWLERDTLARCQFLDRMEQIRRELNRSLFLGLFEFESHFAEYPPGAGYRRHFDSFRGAADRTVSAVAYLNPQWSDADGGELVLYAPEGRAEMARIPPCAGTLVLFLSEEIPHEVLPARRPRASIAGWFLRRRTDNPPVT